jgi:hypothetical protein
MHRRREGGMRFLANEVFVEEEKPLATSDDETEVTTLRVGPKQVSFGDRH